MNPSLSLIQQYAKNAPETSGVYQFYNQENQLLYIGKAKNLKQRLYDYTQIQQLSVRIKSLVLNIHRIEVIHTSTESEALILESQLIKRLQPKYNIIFKDNKFYPFVAFSKHAFPRIIYYRGKQNKQLELFGPFTSSEIPHNIIDAFQITYGLRTCPDTVFNNRVRPCLLHEVEKCSAPCVNKVSPETYTESLKKAKKDIRNNFKSLLTDIHEKMQIASDELAFETAIKYRNLYTSLSQIQAKTLLEHKDLKDSDIIIYNHSNGHYCILVFHFKEGLSYGNQSFFTHNSFDLSSAELLHRFLTDYYHEKNLPPSLYLIPLQDDNLNEWIQIYNQHQTHTHLAILPDKFNLIETKLRLNVQETLKSYLKNDKRFDTEFNDLSLVMNTPIYRIESYDNSHFRGDYAVGGMVVAEPNGLIKAEFRAFYHSEGLNTEDDLAMMKDMVKRRFTGSNKQLPKPSLMLIDGSFKQAKVVYETLKSLNLESIIVVYIQKTIERKPIDDQLLHYPSQTPINFNHHKQLRFFLQYLRDEVHQFAKKKYFQRFKTEQLRPRKKES